METEVTEITINGTTYVPKGSNNQLAETLDGMRFVIENHRQIVEGSAGVTIAAFLKEKEKFVGKNSALIMCGGNVSFEKLQKIIGGKDD